MLDRGSKYNTMYRKNRELQDEVQALKKEVSELKWLIENPQKIFEGEVIKNDKINICVLEVFVVDRVRWVEFFDYETNKKRKTTEWNLLQNDLTPPCWYNTRNYQKGRIDGMLRFE